MCVELRVQHTRAGSPWAELCVGPLLLCEPCPRDKRRDNSQSTAPRTQSHLPLWSLCKTDLIPTPSSSGKVPGGLSRSPDLPVQSHLPSADAGKQEAEEQVSELPYLLSDLFYHTLKKKIPFWTLKDTSFTRPRYTCVCIYRLCTIAPEALAPISEGELPAEQWLSNIPTHQGCYCSAGPIQDKHLQEMLQF